MRILLTLLENQQKSEFWKGKEFVFLIMFSILILLTMLFLILISNTYTHYGNNGKYDKEKLEKLPKTIFYGICFPKSFSFCLSLSLYIYIYT